jgi:hypothetical protein
MLAELLQSVEVTPMNTSQRVCRNLQTRSGSFDSLPRIASKGIAYHAKQAG